MEVFKRDRKKTGKRAKKEYIAKWLKDNKAEQFARNNELFKLARMKKRIAERQKRKAGSDNIIGNRE